MVEIDAAELKQLQKENRVLRKKFKRAQDDLKRLEQAKNNRESLHCQVILELQDSQTTLEANKRELEQLLEYLQKTQKELLEAEKLSALGRLVAGVAHEINTPVGTSVTLVSTLMHETEQFGNLTASGSLKRSQLNDYINVVQETTELIAHNLNRAGELVKTFKQVAVDQSHHEHRPFEITAYLRDVGKSLQTFINKKGHNLIIEGPEIYIDSYPGLFAQIITNFIMNSLNHAFQDHEQGTLYLKTTLQDQQLNLAYRDNGCGIPESLFSKVFEPFFTTGRDFGGTGLGLHIVYNIVTQKLQGEIELNSVLGEGTQFEVTVPVTLVSNLPPALQSKTNG